MLPATDERVQSVEAPIAFVLLILKSIFTLLSLCTTSVSVISRVLLVVLASITPQVTEPSVFNEIDIEATVFTVVLPDIATVVPGEEP